MFRQFQKYITTRALEKQTRHGHGKILYPVATTNCYLLAQKLTPHEMWSNQELTKTHTNADFSSCLQVSMQGNLKIMSIFKSKN